MMPKGYQGIESLGSVFLKELGCLNMKTSYGGISLAHVEINRNEMHRCL